MHYLCVLSLLLLITCSGGAISAAVSASFKILFTCQLGVPCSGGEISEAVSASFIILLTRLYDIINASAWYSLPYGAISDAAIASVMLLM